MAEVCFKKFTVFVSYKTGGPCFAVSLFVVLFHFPRTTRPKDTSFYKNQNASLNLCGIHIRYLMIHTNVTKTSEFNYTMYYLFSSWSPFKLSRSEAEELLSRAEPGAFVFSHDMTSELFLSIW